MKPLYPFIIIILTSFTLIGQNTHKHKLVNEIEVLTASIEATPYDADMYVERAKAIFELNAMDPDQTLVAFKLQDAIKDMDVAISLNCNDPQLYSIRAELQRDIHVDYAKALEDMDKAIELAPDNSELYLQRANYQHLAAGCVDYRKCALHDDKRCEQIVREACMEFPKTNL